MAKTTPYLGKSQIGLPSCRTINFGVWTMKIGVIDAQKTLKK